ncbi:PP2C family protein-serine/threonine phosphatase [Nonomuraea sp. NPDC049400]|uniref:PP2C family protein-serine/threonine phosphatase n=1 Tax=Nonomuraea sp. NPDC049400 TaxID=3364352 RepID=UPI0037ACAA03
MSESCGIERMLVTLLEASHTSTLERLPALATESAALAGLGEVAIYLADLQQVTLRRLKSHDADDEPADEMRVDGTLAGRAFQEVRVLPQGGDRGERYWWVPLLDGTERLGLLRVGSDAAEVPPAAVHLAGLIALLVVSQRTQSDQYQRLVRSRPMNVAAEMQWRLLPPLTFATPEVTVSAVLEPAYEVGGDVFDYALYGDTLHLAVFDAMGHDVSAGLTANLAMAASRNHRRQDMDLTANSQAIERVLISEFGRGTRYVTAVMADLNLRTGLLTWINRGHPLPVLIRGGRWITTLTCPPAHPLGLDLDMPVTVCREQLEPGDRLLLYTDGIVEAGAAQGREFGLTRFVDFIVRQSSSSLPVPETLRRLIRGILDYHDGELHDDATVVATEWHGFAGSAFRREDHE